MSVYKMVKGFVKEAVKFAKEGAPHVTAKQYEQRLNACFSCPHFKSDVERCGLCGCLVEHKAKWATTTCPDKEVKRWDPVKVGSAGKRITLKKDGPKGDTTDTSNKTQPTNTEG
tara:strand:- start:1334 stop:1675 length:342 start_codon:yes stop_codon:yes gene_type:complete